MPLTTVPNKKQLSSLHNMNGMWCARDVDGYVNTQMSNINSITHIGIEGEPENHVTSFGVKYDTAEDKKESQIIELATVGLMTLKVLTQYFLREHVFMSGSMSLTLSPNQSTRQMDFGSWYMTRYLIYLAY